MVPEQHDGHVEPLWILLAGRTSAAQAQAAVLNQVRALLITVPALCGRSITCTGPGLIRCYQHRLDETDSQRLKTAGHPWKHP